MHPFNPRSALHFTMHPNCVLRQIIDAARCAPSPEYSTLHAISFLRYLDDNASAITDPRLRETARSICIKILELIDPMDSHPFSEEMRHLSVRAFVACIEPVKLM